MLRSTQPSYWIYQIVSNILLFVPLGFLLPMSFPYFQKWYRCIFTLAGFSVWIELTQYIFSLGITETDDVMHNTMGATLGYFIFYHISKRKKDKME